MTQFSLVSLEMPNLATEDDYELLFRKITIIHCAVASVFTHYYFFGSEYNFSVEIDLDSIVKIKKVLEESNVECVYYIGELGTIGEKVVIKKNMCL